MNLFAPIEPIVGVAIVLGCALVAMIPLVLLGLRWGMRSRELQTRGRIETARGTYTFTPKEGGN